jgi:predicted nucleic acid-binding protein
LHRTDLIVSDLAVTEMASALARGVRQKEIEARDASLVYRQLLQDLAGEQFHHVHLEPEVHREAERLLSTIGHSVALRAADALHLATAMFAGAQGFVTYDPHLRVAGSALGTVEIIPRVDSR